MAILHRSGNNLAETKDLEQNVHHLAKLTHSATLWRAVLTTLYTLIEFASPVVLLLCMVKDIQHARAPAQAKTIGNVTVAENAKTDPVVYADAFQLLLASTSSIGALLSCHHFHASASKALKCLDAVLTVVELDLGRGVRQGWGGSSSSASTSNRSSNASNEKKDLNVLLHWICLDCSHAYFSPSPWPSSCLRWQ